MYTIKKTLKVHKEEMKKVFTLAFGYISSFASFFPAVFCERVYVHVCVLRCIEVCLCVYLHEYFAYINVNILLFIMGLCSDKWLINHP